MQKWKIQIRTPSPRLLRASLSNKPTFFSHWFTTVSRLLAVILWCGRNRDQKIDAIWIYLHYRYGRILRQKNTGVEDFYSNNWHVWPQFWIGYHEYAHLITDCSSSKFVHHFSLLNCLITSLITSMLLKQLDIRFQ